MPLVIPPIRMSEANADVSHKGPCLNIINGVITEVEVKNHKGKIKFEIFE